MKVKHVLFVLFVALSSGCGAQWTEAPKALDPVSQNLFPVAGDTLLALSDSYHRLCDKRAEEAECQKVKAVLNKAVDAYNKANDLILEAY